MARSALGAARGVKTDRTRANHVAQGIAARRPSNVSPYMVASGHWETILDSVRKGLGKPTGSDLVLNRKEIPYVRYE
jgi:hypothetical protein